MKLKVNYKQSEVPVFITNTQELVIEQQAEVEKAVTNYIRGSNTSIQE